MLIVTFLGIGSVFGGMQVSLAAFSESIGEPGLNGVLYGVFAAGNMLSGIVCGAVAWKVAPQRRLVIGYAALALRRVRTVGRALRGRTRRDRPPGRHVHRLSP